VNFEYSTNATDLVTGTYTNVPSLAFATPDTATAGAKNGNAAADRTALSSTVSGLSIPNGATFWIRWNDTDATGADDGLAVDDFSLTPFMTTAATVPIGGRVLDSNGRGVRGARVVLSMPDGNTVMTSTNAFGYYRFESVQSGGSYVVHASVRGLSFASKIVTVNDAVADLDFSPQ